MMTTLKIAFLSVASIMIVNAWVSPISSDKKNRYRQHHHPKYRHCPCREHTCTTMLVVSRDRADFLHRETIECEDEDEDEYYDDDGEEGNVPYVISRGDGSKGGGGLPMPGRQSSSSEHQEDNYDMDEDLLRRPKVNADMPLG